MKVRPVDVEQRRAEVLLGGRAMRGAEERRAILPAQELHRLRADADTAHLAQVEGVEKPNRVGPRSIDAPARPSPGACSNTSTAIPLPRAQRRRSNCRCRLRRSRRAGLPRSGDEGLDRARDLRGGLEHREVRPRVQLEHGEPVVLGGEAVLQVEVLGVLRLAEQ